MVDSRLRGNDNIDERLFIFPKKKRPRPEWLPTEVSCCGITPPKGRDDSLLSDLDADLRGEHDQHQTKTEHANANRTALGRTTDVECCEAVHQQGGYDEHHVTHTILSSGRLSLRESRSIKDRDDSLLANDSETDQAVEIGANPSKIRLAQSPDGIEHSDKAAISGRLKD